MPARSSPHALLIVALLILAASVPALLALPAELADGNRLILLALAFPAVAAALALLAVRQLLDLRRFGEVSVQLDHDPAPLGGELAGTITVERGLTPDASPEVAVVCARVRRRREGRRSVRMDVLWSRAGPATIASRDAPARLGFAFALPADLPPSGEDGADTEVRWSVELTAPARGPDLARSLPVTVAAVEPAPAEVRDPRALTDHATRDEGVPPALARVHEALDALVVDLPARRRRGRAAGLLGFGGIFLAAAAGIAVAALDGFGLLLAPFVLVFGTVGLGIVALGVHELGRGSTVRVDDHGVTVTPRCAGRPGTPTVVPLDRIDALRLVVSGTTADVRGTRPWWTLVAVVGGEDVELVDAVPSTRQAQALAHLVRRHLLLHGRRVEVAER